MKTGRKLIALLTVFMMVFGNLPAIAVADADHPYYYTGSTTNSGSISTSAGTRGTAQIQLGLDDSSLKFYTYCADSAHNLRSEHYRIAALTDGNIRAIVNANIGTMVSDLGLSMNNSERTEAVQAAIWHFSNGLDLTGSNDADVITLYNALIALPSAGAGSLPTQATVTLELTGVSFQADEDLDMTFRYKSSDSSVSLTVSVNNGTLGTATTDGDWKVVTVTNVDRDNDFRITVSGTQTLHYGASFFIPESADNGGTLGQKLVGNPGNQNVNVSASYETEFGGMKLKKAFSSPATTADRDQNFLVNISGGPNGAINRNVSVPGTGTEVTVRGLPFGNYVVAELLTDSQKYRYTNVSIVNSDTSNNTVLIDSTRSDRNGTATVTNGQRGSITVAKALTPADTTSTFSFNISGPSFPAGGENFTLKHGESKSFHTLLYGTYTVTETPQAGYLLTGYTGDGTTSGGSRTLVVDNNHRVLSFTANNEKRGSIAILKTDTITHGPVSGVTFHVTGPGIDRNYVTDATGRIDIIDLGAGTYTVTEIDVPVGYRINNPDPVSQTIGVGGTATFNFSDDPVGRLNLIKQDMAGNPLPGAVFWVSADPNFGTYTVYDTAANTSILTNWMIASGTYYVKEVQAPAGYMIPAEDTKQVTLTQGETTPVTFNDPKDEGSLLIKKSSSYQGQAVANATFQVSRNADFTDLVSLPNGGKTNANGELLVEGLASGKYWVRETGAAPGYDFDITDVRNVTISYNNRSESSFVNHPQGRVRIVKTDAFNDAPLAGAVFGIYSDPDCETLVATLASTDGDGLATSAWLPFSTGTIYYVKEISAPARYNKDNSVKQAVFTTPGQTLDVSFENTRKFGGLSVHKSLTSFAGDTQSFSFTLTGPSYPSGYDFTLANGQTKDFTNLDFGTYTITETVSLPYELTGFSGGNGTRNGNSYTVVLGSTNQDFTVTASNRRLAELEIGKALQEGVTGDTTDFNFTITGPNGFTDSFTLKAGETKPYANLAYGDYTITELAVAEGYRLGSFSGGNGTQNGNSYTVTLGATNLDVQVTADNVKQGKLEVIKTEAGAQPPVYLAGAVFGIYSDAAANNLVQTMVGTGANGHAVSGWLDPGTYYVKEITAPDGYVLNTIIVEATVTAGETAQLAPIANQKNEGSIRVTKLDRQTGDPVEGVTFQLLDKDPRIDDTFTVLQELVTNASGVVEFLHLTPGTTYFVRETQQAPGYSIDITDVREVTVVLAEATDITFENDQVGDFKIVKTDGHGTYLEGAEFLVADNAEFTNAFPLVTLADGTVTSDLLTVGTWYVKETKAPDGYVIDETVKTVVIEQFTTATVTFTNTKYEGWIVVHKISNMTEESVQGVTFELLDLDPTDPAFTSANIIASALTDANGEARFDHLTPGKTYWVRETVPAPGYDIDADNAQSVTVVFNEPSYLTFANNPVGYVRITKVDAEDETKKLEGAVYGIYRFDLAQYASFAEDDVDDMPPPDYTVTTGPDGIGISDYIPFSYSTIFLVIELTPPTGYLLSDEFYFVTFSEPGEIVDVTFHNIREEGSLVVLKVDALNPDKTLGGAEFKLYTEEALINQVGNAVTSDANGMVRFDDLKPGTYWLVETKAPTDYDLLTDPIPVVVEAGVTDPEPLVIKNQYNPPQDIETGMMDWNILILSGLVLLAGLALVLFARKRKAVTGK